MKADSATPGFSSRQRWVIAARSAASGLAMLALVLMVNYLSSRHYRRLHWASPNPHQLSVLTQNFLGSLTNAIQITVFFDQQSPLYSSVSSLLAEYQQACPRTQIEYVDYMRNPGAAQLVKERYRLSFPEANNDTLYRNLVIFDSGGRMKIVHEKELSDLGAAPDSAPGAPSFKRVNFKGELMFTSAIVAVTDARRFRACFVTGHSEHDPRSDNPQMGYSKLAQILEQNNIEVQTIDLARQEIPPDSLVIIAGPQSRYDPVELDRLNGFLARGGRLLALMNNLGRTGLEGLLSSWGVRIGDEVVLEIESGGSGAAKVAASRNLVLTNYLALSHPIVRPLLRSRLHLVLPRTVEKRPGGRPDADAPRVEPLAASGQNSFATADIRDEVLYENLFRNRRGPIPVMAAVEKGSVPGISVNPTSTRIVVVGDSIFLGNYMIDSLNNRDFAVLSINWLLDRSQLMGGIGPRPVREFQVVMTPAQLTAVRWLLLLALPGCVLFVGLLVWWRRRH